MGIETKSVIEYAYPMKWEVDGNHKHNGGYCILLFLPFELKDERKQTQRIEVKLHYSEPSARMRTQAEILQWVVENLEQLILEGKSEFAGYASSKA